jgi:hypothetical protein
MVFLRFTAEYHSLIGAGMQLVARGREVISLCTVLPVPAPLRAYICSTGKSGAKQITYFRRDAKYTTVTAPARRAVAHGDFRMDPVWFVRRGGDVDEHTKRRTTEHRGARNSAQIRMVWLRREFRLQKV